MYLKGQIRLDCTQDLISFLSGRLTEIPQISTSCHLQIPS